MCKHNNSAVFEEASACFNAFLRAFYTNDVYHAWMKAKQQQGLQTHREMIMWLIGDVIPEVPTLERDRHRSSTKTSQRRRPTVKVEIDEDRTSSLPISQAEALRSCDALLITLCGGAPLYEQWRRVKCHYGFASESQFISWALSLVPHITNTHHRQHSDKDVEATADYQNCTESVPFHVPLTDPSQNEAAAQCLLCRSRFVTEKELTFHIECVHLKLPVEQRSINWELTFPRKCDLCGVQIEKLVSMKKHYAANHPGYKAFTCSLCGATFELHRRWEDHLRRRHSIVLGSRPLKLFPNKSVPQTRRQMERGTQCVVDVKTCQSRYKCGECGFAFESVGALYVHERVHAEENKRAVMEAEKTDGNESRNSGKLKIPSANQKHFMKDEQSEQQQCHRCGECGMPFQNLRPTCDHYRCAAKQSVTGRKCKVTNGKEDKISENRERKGNIGENIEKKVSVDENRDSEDGVDVGGESEDDRDGDVHSGTTVNDKKDSHERHRCNSGKTVKPPPPLPRPQHKCQLCPAEMEKFMDLRRHYSAVHPEHEPYACEKCDKRFGIYSRLVQHTRHRCPGINKRDQKTFQCTHHCNMTFTCERTFNCHMAKIHGIKKESQRARKQMTCFCAECGRGFTKSWILQQHMRRYHSEEPPVEKPQYVRPPQHWMCDNCGRVFTAKATLTEHMETQHEKKANRYRCVICEFETYSSRFFKEHVALRHSVIRAEASGDVSPVYQCDECNTQLASKEELWNHMHQAHVAARKRALRRKDGKQHVCEQCGMAFYTGSGMREHMRRHNEERPYGCAMCSTWYKWKRGLRRHMRTAHGSSGGRGEGGKGISGNVAMENTRGEPSSAAGVAVPSLRAVQDLAAAAAVLVPDEQLQCGSYLFPWQATATHSSHGPTPGLNRAAPADGRSTHCT